MSRFESFEAMNTRGLVEKLNEYAKRSTVVDYKIIREHTYRDGDTNYRVVIELKDKQPQITQTVVQHISDAEIEKVVDKVLKRIDRQFKGV